MDSKKLNYILGSLLGIALLAGGVFAGLAFDKRMGIAQNASKFTNLEVTNEVLIYGDFTGVAADFTGAITGSLGLAISAGDTNVENLVQGGATTGFTVSTTAKAVSANTFSASNICDQTYLPITVGNTTSITLYLPTAALLYDDCLTANGDVKDLYIYNTSAVTSTVLTAGTSTTIKFASTTAAVSVATLEAAQGTIARFIRTAAATLQVLFINMD